MGKTCPDCGGEVTLSVADDPRTGTGREQYICIECGNYHGGGKFR